MNYDFYLIRDEYTHKNIFLHFTAQWQIVFQGKFILQSVFYYTF